MYGNDEIKALIETAERLLIPDLVKTEARMLMRAGKAPEPLPPREPEPEGEKRPRRFRFHDLERHARRKLGFKSGGLKGHLQDLTPGSDVARNRRTHEEYFAWRTGQGITESYKLTDDERKDRISKRISRMGVKADPERADSPVFRRGRPVPPDEVQPSHSGGKIPIQRKSPPTIIDPVKPNPNDPFAALPKRPALPDWMKAKK